MEKYSVIERLECPGCIYAEDLAGILTVIYLIYGRALMLIGRMFFEIIFFNTGLSADLMYSN